MKTNKNLPTNPSSVKTRFAIKFVQAMKKLNKKRPPKASMANRYNRYIAIRAVACVSMASAVGPRRAWSRAVLMNIRNLMPRQNKSFKRLRNNNNNPKGGLGFGEEDELRRLVPGGQRMGFCRLLSESAHYIQCLRDQIDKVLLIYACECMVQFLDNILITKYGNKVDDTLV